MTKEEINEGIREVCRISIEVEGFYAHKEQLVAKLNSIPQVELQQAADWYASRSGVIVDLRKEVVAYLKAGNKLDIETLDGLVLKHKAGKENKFRVYKNYYTIFFPIITFYGHNAIRAFIEKFISEIIEQLQIKDYVKKIYFDFQGPRQQGSNRLWLAIYNKEQETQSSGIQMFVDFEGGRVKYGVFHYASGNYLKGPVEVTPENFDYASMIKFFDDNKHLIINDIPKKAGTLPIQLGDKRVYKISHGTFKAKANESIRNVFKENEWIVIHESTGKGQADNFKNGLAEGDYVYITIGGDELFAVARVKDGSWGYVPEDIVDEAGWIYRDVEYVKFAFNRDTSSLKSYKEFIYPSGNSTFVEITADKINEANNRIFIPHFGIEFISTEAAVVKIDGNIPKFPNNIILYGPPGTGKTFNAIDKAVEIITGVRRSEHRENKKDFDQFIREGQIEFITFHQHYSYEDFMVGIKPDIDYEQLRFQPYKGVFYEIAKRARDNYMASITKQPEARTFGDVLSEIIAPLTEKGEPVKIKMSSGVFYTITDVNEFSIYFEKPNGKSQHTLNIRTLEEIVDGLILFRSGLRPYYDPLAELIREKKKDVKGLTRTKMKNFVLIVDEINRANISKVFGELITLLEEDKRIGAENELRVTLPNGEKEFGVPPNLYLIGTMNTADKSIALIDIALRRRFEFIAYFPDHSKLVESDGEFLRYINRKIYSLKKSADYLIGHGYFMNEADTKKVIRNKVIPLLMEYFSGKTDIVKDVFEGSLWKVNYDTERYDWIIEEND